MTKATADLRSLARTHTETAVRTLAGIMRQTKSPAAARVAAAQALLDRGWGKAAQPLTGDETNPIAILARLERVIVDPSNSAD